MPITKKALIRKVGYPVGEPAPLYIVCLCSNILDMPGTGASCGFCGRTWDNAGWLLNGPKQRSGQS